VENLQETMVFTSRIMDSEDERRFRGRRVKRFRGRRFDECKAEARSNVWLPFQFPERPERERCFSMGFP
jgi:hypothetical protein